MQSIHLERKPKMFWELFCLTKLLEVFGPGNDLMETQTDKLRQPGHKLKLSLTHLQQVAQCAGGLAGSSDTDFSPGVSLSFEHSSSNKRGRSSKQDVQLSDELVWRLWVWILIDFWVLRFKTVKCDRNKDHVLDLLAQADRNLVSRFEVVGSSLVWV